MFIFISQYIKVGTGIILTGAEDHLSVSAFDGFRVTVVFFWFACPYLQVNGVHACHQLILWHLWINRSSKHIDIKTSSNVNIFRVTGPLCGEFTGPGEVPTQRPVTRSFDIFFDLRLNKRLSKQPWDWWFETPSWSLWHQCNGVKIKGSRRKWLEVKKEKRSTTGLNSWPLSF